jgi:hypothetical protein
LEGVVLKNERAFFIFGSICAFVSVAAWIGYVIALPSVTAAASASDIVERFRALDGVRFALSVQSWGGLWGALLGIPAFYAFFRAFRRDDGLLRIPLIAAVIGLGFIALSHTAIRLSLLYHFGPAVLDARPEALPIMAKIGDAMSWALSQLEFVGSFLAYGAGIGLFAFFTLSRDGIAKIISILGIVCGAAGVMWMAGYLPLEMPGWLPVLAYLNIALALIWQAAMGVLLLSRSGREPA